MNKKERLPEGRHYGLRDIEFENMIKFLEKKGFIERVLRVGDHYSLKPAILTQKGERFLLENKELEESYPADRDELMNWVEIDKKMYSNDAANKNE